MKILELNWSPRSHGDTRCILQLCNMQFENIKISSKYNVNYEIVSIYDQNLKCCKGCRNCLTSSTRVASTHALKTIKEHFYPREVK